MTGGTRSSSSTTLTSDGAPMITMGQGFASMSAPTKDLQRLIKVGAKVDEQGAGEAADRHGGNPLLRWRWTTSRWRWTRPGT
jgi:hypothetical protein